MAFGLRWRQPFRDLGATYLKKKEEPPGLGQNTLGMLRSRNARNLGTYIKKGRGEGGPDMGVLLQGHGTTSAFNHGYSFCQGSDVI